jgi:hypothetical protein
VPLSHVFSISLGLVRYNGGFSYQIFSVLICSELAVFMCSFCGLCSLNLNFAKYCFHYIVLSEHQIYMITCGSSYSNTLVVCVLSESYGVQSFFVQLCSVFYPAYLCYSKSVQDQAGGEPTVGVVAEVKPETDRGDREDDKSVASESGSDEDSDGSGSEDSEDSEEERRREEERTRRRAERLAAIAARAIAKREDAVARLEGEKAGLEMLLAEREKEQAQEVRLLHGYFLLLET